MVAGVVFSCVLMLLCVPELYESKVRLTRSLPARAERQAAQRAVLLEPPKLRAARSGQPIQRRQAISVRAKATNKKSVVKDVLTASDGEPSLGVRARRTTDELMQDFNFSMNHGFHAGAKLTFPNKTHGEIPPIAPDEVLYEQYVIVEVTIDVDGTVAAARLTTGKVPAKTEEKLIAAIRRFRYAPATRDGIAVPSLMDIVIHVPS